MKLKIEELKKIPYKITTELNAIKLLEDNNKKRLMVYREKEKEIKDKYEYLEKLIWDWNREQIKELENE